MDAVLVPAADHPFPVDGVGATKLYAVSNQAHDRGYGPPEDIVPVEAGTEIACLKQFSSVFFWLQICRHRRDHESNACVVLTWENSNPLLGILWAVRHAGH